MINLWKDTAGNVIYLFLVLDCHTVASFTNLENGKSEGEYQLNSKNEQIETLWLSLQYLFIP